MHMAPKKRQRHAGAGAARANEPDSSVVQGTTARPVTEPDISEPAVKAVTAAAGGTPTSVERGVASESGRLSSRVLVSADSRTFAQAKDTVSIEAAAEAAKAGETDVSAMRCADVAGDLSAAAPSADAAAVAKSTTGFSQVPAGRKEFAGSRRSVRGADSRSSAVAAESRQGGARGEKGAVTGVRKSSTGKNNSDSSRCLRVRDSCHKARTQESCRRGRKRELEINSVTAGEAAEEEAKQVTAGGAETVGARDSDSSCDCVDPKKALKARKAAKDDGRSKKKEKRKAYQRLKAYLKPSVVPLRTPVMAYPLGAFPADERTAESPTSSGLSVSAGVLMATRSRCPVPQILSDGAVCDNAALGRDSDLVGDGAAEGGKIGPVYAAAQGPSVSDGQLHAAAAATAIRAGVGDDEEETWRGSSRSRASAAGGRVGRFSAAERAAVCAALRQYAVDNGLEDGSVEAAVEHLMTAQDVSSSPTDGAKRHGPWRPEEVQTLLRMESELRVSQPRNRFARIAAVLNRTASSVYDKWKEIRPRLFSLACAGSSQDAAAQQSNIADTVHSKDDTADAAAVSGLAADAAETRASAPLSEDDTPEGNAGAGARTTEALVTATSQDSWRRSNYADSAGNTEGGGTRQPYHQIEPQSYDAEVQQQQQQQQWQLLDEERPTGGDGGASGNEKEDGSGDSRTATVKEYAAKGAAAKRGKGSVLYERRCDLQPTESTVQSRTKSGAAKSRGEPEAEMKPAGIELAGFSQETNAAQVAASEREMNHTRESEDVRGKATLTTALEKAKGAVSAGSHVERRAHFGTTEQVLQLLRAVQEQTGECLPATGISWSSLQKQHFPYTSASQLRLYYTTRLVPKELAKRMGVSAAEPVLLRFVVRCLDSLLNVKQTQRRAEGSPKEIMYHCSKAGDMCESLVPVSARPHRNGPRKTLVNPRGEEGVAPATASERGERYEMSHMEEGRLNIPIIDSVCDVDWLEILPFCPTALPPFVFRRGVAALPPTKSGEGERRHESVQLAQQVLLLKEHLDVKSTSKDAGRDAALLLRAALPREVLARAVRHELRKRRRKRMQKEQRKQSITQQPGSSIREHQRPEERQQQEQVEWQREYHENGGLRGDGTPASAAVDRSGGRSDASLSDDSDPGEDSGECPEGTAEAHDEEEEEAREQAKENEMTEAEREKKWHREEKLLGRAALLALLRRAGGKEMRRLRRRNRKCFRVKKDVDGAKCYSPAADHVEEVRSNCFVVGQLGWTHTSSCDAERNAVSAYSSPGEKRPLLSQLQDIRAGNETSESLDTAPAHPQNRNEYGETIVPADSHEQHSQSSVVEEERASPLRPQVNGKRPRRRHRQRDQPDLLTGEFSAGGERQQEKISVSSEISGAAEDVQRELCEETDTTTEVRRAVRHLEQQVEGLTQDTTEGAGHECQQLDEEVYGITEFWRQALTKQKHKKRRKRIGPDESNRTETKKATTDLALQCQQLDEEVSGTTELPGQASMRHKHKKQRKRIDADESNRTETEKATTDLALQRQQLDEEVNGVTDFSRQASMKQKHKKKRKRIDPDESNRTETEKGTTDIALQRQQLDEEVNGVTDFSRQASMKQKHKKKRKRIDPDESNRTETEKATTDLALQRQQLDEEVNGVTDFSRQASTKQKHKKKRKRIDPDEFNRAEIEKAATDVALQRQQLGEEVYDGTELSRQASIKHKDKKEGKRVELDKADRSETEKATTDLALQCQQLDEEVSGTTELPGQASMRHKHKKQRKRIDADESNRTETEKAATDLALQRQQLDGDVHGIAAASELAPIRNKHKKKRKRIAPDEAYRTETENITADPAAQCDLKQNVWEEEREAVHDEEALIQGTLDIGPGPDDRGRTGPIIVPNGEEILHEGRRKRKKKKEKSAVNADTQPDDDIRQSSADCLARGKEHFPVHVVSSIQDLVALDLQPERQKERKKIKKKKNAREGRHGELTAKLVADNQGANPRIIDASVHDLEGSLPCKSARDPYSCALKENSTAPVNQLLALEEPQEATFSSSSVQLPQKLMGLKQDQRGAPEQHQQCRELQQIRTNPEQHPLPCEKQRESLPQEVDMRADDGEEGQRMHVGPVKERKKKKKRRKNKLDERDGVAMEKTTPSSSEGLLEDTVKIHQEPVRERTDNSVPFPYSVGGREELQVVEADCHPPTFAAERVERRRKKKHLHEDVNVGE